MKTKTRPIATLLIIIGVLICSSNTMGQSILDRLASNTISESRTVPLDIVLRKFEHRYHVSFLYKSDVVKGRLANVREDLPAKLSESLSQILTPLHLGYSQLSGNSYAIYPLEARRQKTIVQQVTIKGKVTDASSGEGLPGVNVLIKGTNLGTATDRKGNYSLNVPDPADTLIFSYIGYKSQIVPIEGQSTINVKLESQALQGQQLIVVGYGTQKKENVTGAISTISSSDLGKQPVVNVDQALEGKSTGLTIVQNSGSPGSSAKVLIRGLGTINNSSPLYVVDGVPLTSNGINSIDPSNIASVQVLKDASSEAIYGSRGANGVILITTKNGRSGQSKISINAYRGVQQVEKKINLLNGQQFISLND